MVEREEKALIVEAGGVGYRVVVLEKTLVKMQDGEAVEFRIYHHITDSSQDLFGFETASEMEYFKLLLGVPSIGPRTAMNILDAAPPSVLRQAVAERDVTLLTKVSGVGKRTAERLLVELQGKMGVSSSPVVSGTLQHETTEALISIGFTPAQARGAAAKLPKDVTTVEEAVKVALKER